MNNKPYWFVLLGAPGVWQRYHKEMQDQPRRLHTDGAAASLLPSKCRRSRSLLLTAMTAISLVFVISWSNKQSTPSLSHVMRVILVVQQNLYICLYGYTCIRVYVHVYILVYMCTSIGVYEYLLQVYMCRYSKLSKDVLTKFSPYVCLNRPPLDFKILSDYRPM